MTIERPGGDRPAPLAAGAHAEDGRRRLFWFALQSRSRRRKKVAGRPLREDGRGTARTLRPDQVIKGRDGSPWSRQKAEGGLTRHTTRAQHWHRIGRMRVDAIDSITGHLSAMLQVQRWSRGSPFTVGLAIQ